MRVAALSDVAEVNPPLPPSAVEDGESAVSFLPMSAVSEEGIVVTEQQRRLREVSRGYTAFRRGDVLLAKITPCMENGKAAHTEGLNHPIGFGSTEFHVIRPGPEIDGGYLFYAVWNPHFRFAAARRMTGSAGQRRVPAEFVRRYRIAVPPLDEQKRIAAILGKADAIRRKRQEAIALTGDLLRSVFLDMFGDPATNPKGWDEKTIGAVCDVKTGKTPSRRERSYYGADVPWVKTAEVTDGVITRTEEMLSHAGCHTNGMEVFPRDTLIVAMYGQGATRGRTARLGIAAATNQACAAILPSAQIDAEYLWTVLRMSYDRLRALGRGGNQPNLNLSMIRDFKVPLPPRAARDRFTDVHRRVNGLRKSAEESSLLASDLFASLSQRAFRGEL